jgi:hypothetical protein
MFQRADWVHLVLLVLLLADGMAAGRNMKEYEGTTERGPQEGVSAEGHSYSSCGDDTALFHVERVRLEPERISRGSTANFRIVAALEAGRHVGNLESALVSMRATYHSTEVFREEDRICDVAEVCPLPRDGQQFQLVYVKEFPIYTPPGPYEVELRGRVDEVTLFCLRVRFRVAFFRSSSYSVNPISV